MPDTQHAAVMALIYAPADSNSIGACTGTTVQAMDGVGYLLTAAHCVGLRHSAGELALPFKPVATTDLFVVPGNDWAQACVAHPAQDYQVHAGFTGEPGSPDDLAVIRFHYGNAADPAVIAPLTAAEDELSVGDPFTLVGYGRTDGNAQNSARNQVERAISRLGSRFVEHSQDGGGTCQGDSGGPGLVQVGGTERVAVVSSLGISQSMVDPCSTGVGVGVRVSAYESFIFDYLDAEVDPDCDLCLDGAQASACSAEATNCDVGSDCYDYFACAATCASATCGVACAVQFQAGYVDYLKLLSCSCNACDECGTGTVCEQTECGYSNASEWCPCILDNCCAQANDCVSDSTCLACTTVEGFTAGCAASSELQALDECIAACEDECSDDAGSDPLGDDMVNWRDAGSEDDPDAGDAGAESDAGPDGGADDEVDAGVDAADARGDDDDDGGAVAAKQDGCACRSAGRRSDDPTALALFAGLLSALTLRRRAAARLRV
jgi:hypothetical protein